ncbi:MAG TPA: LysR substrate-binding domain-containing protein, partial [Polyangiaceae bacterium]|nr:LysR substrate-binding domain-containing protein [Polyangiaceae bacterium]
LDGHDCLTFLADGQERPWRFAGKFGSVSYHPRSNFRTNGGEELREAALAGIGIAQTPGWLVARDLTARTLRRILRDYEPEELAISAVWPSGRRLASKVSVFIEFMSQVLAKGKPAR